MNDLTPITKRKESMKEKMEAVKTQGWIFESWIEKLIITGSVLWSAFSILRFIFNLLI